MRNSLQRAAVVGTTLLLALGLSACSAGEGGAASGNQSVKAACDIMEKDMRAVASDMDSAALGADPVAAASTMNQIADQLKTSAKKVTNPEVTKVVGPMIDSFDKLGTALEKISDDPSAAMELASDMQTLSTDMQEAGMAYNKVCKG
ncbi:outer membrane murein-binding lipoprotein Lpp [Mycetocola sp. BIGb0189]|uniref:hypothetical protein n=1 Tax=Mycetocola sp. BIGb0189 TaxID=2940604 RepID=UPI002167BF91|nr:hypothetical protein [Mycetocola sp. BIGb0189]MCS4276393.1 outer membrane murein-binding lipoprotein Lpp [Mycetocola sp. BIGb0189]